MTKYRHERISSSTTRIIDIAGVACYLIEGRQKACLVDTCCGYHDLKRYVSTLTHLPVCVILTHGHYDHTGSASLFDDVYMSSLDLPVLADHNKHRHDFFVYDQKTIASLKDYDYQHLNPLLTVQPRELYDHQVFDLGGLHLKMIHVPGHTPGMMCVIIEEERAIIFGDACGNSVLLHDEYATTVSTYLQSLQVLKNCDSQYDHIYRNHGSFVSQKELLDEVIACSQLILSHQDDHMPIEMYGRTLYAAKAMSGGQRSDGRYGNIIYAQDKAR